jgi:hypothetical protein
MTRIAQMPIGAEDWNEIELALSGESAGAFADLRKKFPKLSLTRCDASDFAETPYRRFPRYEVHLIDSSDHCVRITTEPQKATGLIVANRTERA